MSGPSVPRIEAIGEGALLVTLGDRIDLAVNARARRLAAAVDTHRDGDGRLGRAVPAAASVLVPFDPLALDPGEAGEIVARLLEAATGHERADHSEPEMTRPTIEIEVRYGGDEGPDLADVAESHDLRPEDIVELHAGAIWTALFLGFAPGFAYLGPLPPELATPRRSTPRERVPAGSVAIGGDQTGVYPFALPGGWQVIGRTTRPMWSLDRARPNLVGPGDRVRFVPLR